MRQDNDSESELENEFESLFDSNKGRIGKKSDPFWWL